MTDNEIITALECCSCETIMYCEDQCPFYKQCENDEQLSKYALDLINRQKAELDKKDAEIDILIRKKECLRDEISELKAENSNLTSDLTSLQKDLTSAKVKIEFLQATKNLNQSKFNETKAELELKKAEIERLKEKLATTQNYIQKNGLEWGFVSHLEFCKNLKAEAVKEFAERLCEGRVSNDPVVIAVKVELKMVGEGK